MSQPTRSKLILNTALSAKIVQRSLKVSAVVGTILIVINHGEAVLARDIDTQRLIKMLLTYCVPYLVSTYSAVSTTLEKKHE